MPNDAAPGGEAGLHARPGRLRALVESAGLQRFVTLVILVNAVTLGLETWPAAMAAAGPVLTAMDRTILGIFVLELCLKLWVYRLGFFRFGWNVFDFAIVAISLVPAAGPFSVLRALRVLRVLRLLSVVPEMRAVVSALLGALPGMGSIAAVMALIFYVGAVLATKLFGQAFPDWFGSLGASMYSLFQIMTLESWSMGIVRPVMVEAPWAWAFFVPFILVTTFAVLNLVVAVIVNSMQRLHDAEMKEAIGADRKAAHDDIVGLAAEVGALRREIVELRHSLAVSAQGREASPSPSNLA
ncbi:MAG: ion transporter [Alphaproteobacteria bacterium]|nr:ion transporter [Alphaproteobacteria bacterium]